jgi:cell division septal protein FtsQ
MRKALPKIIIFIILAFFLFTPFFIKGKAVCKSQLGDCPGEINQKLSDLNGKNIFKVKTESAKILKSSYLVGDFSMQFRLPNAVLINTIIKKPKYAIFDRSKNKYFLIDASGTVLSTADNSSYPTLVKEVEDRSPGTQIGGDDLFALKILEGVSVMYQVFVGTKNNETLVVDMPDGIRVIFPLRDAEPDVLLGSLRLIYTKVTTEYSGKYSQIDMRYKNPVLR